MSSFERRTTISCVRSACRFAHGSQNNAHSLLHTVSWNARDGKYLWRMLPWGQAALFARTLQIKGKRWQFHTQPSSGCSAVPPSQCTVICKQTL